MKIAMIGQKGIPVSAAGGVEKHVQELATRLALQHEVVVYTRSRYTPKALTSFKGVRLVSLPSVPSKHLDAITHTLVSIWHALYREQVDIIHIHSVGPALLAWLPKVLQPKLKVVVTFHSIDRQHQKWNWFAKLMLWLGEWVTIKFADEVIAVSKSIQQYAYEAYHRLSVYIPNGVAVMNQHPANKIFEQFGLTKDSYILVVSRLVRHKGIHHLIQAYQRLQPDKKLVIAGDSVHTDNYVKELKILANGNHNIIFTGNQIGEVLEELFSNAYLCVQPSESEGLSLALLEAAAYGKGILAADIPANIEVMLHCGFTFKSGDVTDLQRMLQYLLIQPDAVAQAGKIARQFVLAHYLWDDIANKTSALYNQFSTMAEVPAQCSKVRWIA